LRTNFIVGFWHLSDPKISLASLASMFLGASLAAADGAIDYGWLAVTVLGILTVEVAKNASGEVYDFDSGADQAVKPADRSPFSGGKRVIVDGLLTRGQTIGIAIGSYAVAVAIGATLFAKREPTVLWLGVVGVALAFFYHAPPLRLVYRGFGEAAVALCYGPLITGGTYLVQRGILPPHVIAVSAPLGLLIAAFLIANEFPDAETDAVAGKRTLVVRLGRSWAGRLHAECVVAAFAILLVLPSFGVARGVWLGVLGALPAHASALRLLAGPTKTARVIPAQKNALLAFVLLALGTGLGALWIR
jgi:1,4-dihydroxy-2-naphthoate polyprenyltransferase